jgi:hypothetical protein
MLQVIKTKPTIINKTEMKNKIYTLSIIAIFFIGIACSPMPEVQVSKFGQVSFAGGKWQQLQKRHPNRKCQKLF